MAAMFRLSWNSPRPTVPSPIMAQATLGSPRILAASATPSTVAMYEPSTALSPKLPTAGSAECRLPPLPPHTPVALPNSSAMIRSPSPEWRCWARALMP